MKSEADIRERLHRAASAIPVELPTPDRSIRRGRTRIRRRILGVGVSALIVASSLGWSVASLAGLSGPPRSPAGGVTEAPVVMTFHLTGFPTGIVADHGAVWVSEDPSGTVQKIDPNEGRVLATIRVPGGAGTLTEGLGAVWAATGGSSIARIDPATDEVTVIDTHLDVSFQELAVGAGSVWALVPDQGVLRIDPTGHDHPSFVSLNEPLRSITYGEGAVWVAGGTDSVVLRIDPSTTKVSTIPVDAPATPVAGSAGSYVGASIDSVIAGGGFVWAGSDSEDRIAQIDPRSDRVVNRVRVPTFGHPGEPAAVTPGDLWIAVTCMCRDGRRWGNMYRYRIADRVLEGPVLTYGLPDVVTAGVGHIWVGDDAYKTLSRVDVEGALPKTTFPAEGHSDAWIVFSLAIVAAGIGSFVLLRRRRLDRPAPADSSLP